MYEIVYFSSANSNLTQKDIRDILSHSRENNSKNGITGCLLHYNEEFLQILEGKKSEVQRLFNIVKKDQRHQNVIVLYEGTKEHRYFSNWKMAFYNLNSSKSNEIFFKKEVIEFSKIAKKPTLAVELFWTMAKHLVS